MSRSRGRASTRFLRLVWDADRRLVRALLLTTALAGLSPALIAWLGKRIVDAVEQVQRSGIRTNDAFLWLGVEAGAMLVFLTSTRLQVIVRRLLGLRVAERLRESIMDETTSLPLVAIEDPATHDRIELARRQASSLPGMFLQHGLGVARGALVVVASALLLIAISPVALVVVLLASLPAFVFQLNFAQRIHRLAREQIVKRREQGYLENLLTRETFAKEVRVFGFGPAMRERFRLITDEIYAAEAKLTTRGALGSALWSALGTAAVYGAYLTVVWQALDGDIGLGDMTMALIVFRQTQNATETLLNDLAGLSHDRLYIDDLLSVLPGRESAVGLGEDHAQSVPAPEGAVTLPKPEDGLRFESVSYTYPGTELEALRDVSFHLTRGHVLGLVGKNGSGKSTLLKLALGLIEPTKGRIYLCGLDLREWPKEQLRAHQAATFQDFARFKLSVDDGLWVGDVESDEEKRQQAATRAGADGFVRALKDGYATRLGRSFPGGVDLSGGQWQRLAIGRGFVRDGAELLVLDEPTAALDPEAEAALFDEIHRLRGSMAIMIAAHRLSALRDADEILLLDQGQVQERGDHAALMSAGGRYAELFSLQAESYRDE